MVMKRRDEGVISISGGTDARVPIFTRVLTSS